MSIAAANKTISSGPPILSIGDILTRYDQILKAVDRKGCTPAMMYRCHRFYAGALHIIKSFAEFTPVALPDLGVYMTGIRYTWNFPLQCFGVNFSSPPSGK